MAEKIFVSYNHNDQDLIDTIARKLAIEFGQNNIFYDKWSTQPGESIIGKMDHGLSDFNTFFLFASENSLASPMVRLEWQTALKKAVQEDLKFVVVKISDCKLPTILSDLLYIDLLSIGIDEAIQQMKDIVNSVSVYRPMPDFENLQAKLYKISDTRIKVIVKAKKYSEQNATIFFACKNSIDDFWFVTTGSWHLERDITIDGKYNARSLRSDDQLRPGFPYEFEVEHKTKIVDPKIYIVIDKSSGKCREIQIAEM